MNSIPLIDFERLQHLDAEIRSVEIKKLDQACREVGFFYLVNTSIEASEMSQLMTAAKMFFSMPQSDKEAIDIKHSINHRGYGKIGEEQLAEISQADWKETFDMALDFPVDHLLAKKYPSMYGLNQYPENATIVEALQNYYVSSFQVSMVVLTAMAEALGLVENFFTQCFKHHVTVLRMIHYPPRPDEAHDNGAGAHTDYGCITLLLQDDIGGLQVKNRQGDWVDATPIKGSLVVNIGDLMQRWTNDHYVSTAHRVMAPLNGVHRYSFPFFVEPDYDTCVECIETCQSADERAKYAPILSGDWIQSRFDATYAYRESDQS